MSVREDRRLKLVYRLMGGPFREGGMTEQTVYRSEADTGEWRERSTRRNGGNDQHGGKGISHSAALANVMVKTK